MRTGWRLVTAQWPTEKLNGEFVLPHTSGHQAVDSDCKHVFSGPPYSCISCILFFPIHRWDKDFPDWATQVIRLQIFFLILTYQDTIEICKSGGKKKLHKRCLAEVLGPREFLLPPWMFFSTGDVHGFHTWAWVTAGIQCVEVRASRISSYPKATGTAFL